MPDLPWIDFKVNQPASFEERNQNIRSALGRTLKAVDSEPLEHITIIAGGPSAKLAPPIPDILAKSQIAVVNGVGKLLLKQGHEPDIWAVCDPQAHVADMMPSRKLQDCVFWVASKCHPSVFDKLLKHKNNVLLWHIDDSPLVEQQRPVRVASSVTLCLLSQLRAIGYRDFDIYGWDGCYIDGQHHAYPQDHHSAGDIELIVGVRQDEHGNLIGGETFQTTTTWALEAQDAVTQLHHADYHVTIHGNGLIKAMIQTTKAITMEKRYGTS